MDANGLFVCPAPSPPPVVGSCGSAPRSKVTGACSERTAPSPTVLESPWWSRPGPITVRSEVISTAPSGCTQGESGGEEEDKRGA